MYDPGSPDTGRSGSGDTLDDRYASVRRTVGPAIAPGGAAGTEERSPYDGSEDAAAPESAPVRDEDGEPSAGDAGSPDSGRGGSGDTLDDRYASVRRTVGPAIAPGGAAVGGSAGTEERDPERAPYVGPEDGRAGADTAPEPAPVREEDCEPSAGPEPEPPGASAREPERGPAEEQPPDPRAGGPLAQPNLQQNLQPNSQREPRQSPQPNPQPRSQRGPERTRGPEPLRGPQPEPRPGPETSPEPEQPPQRQPVGQEARPEAPAGPGRRAEGAGPTAPDAAGVEGPEALAPAGPIRQGGGAGPTAPDAAGVEGPETVAPAEPGDGLAEAEVPPSPDHVGDRPPTYEAEPATFPAADPASLSELVPDTVLDGAHYGGLTLRAASLRGDSARHRGALRRDALLTARFGSGESALLLVAVAAGGRAATGGHRAAREICHSIGGVVGRSHARLAEDIRADRRDALKSGLHRLTDRCYGKLRAQAAALELQPEEYTADLRCLLLSADPRCRTRVFFGSGAGGLFRLRSGTWRDIEPGLRIRDDGSPGDGGSAEDADLDALDPSELGDPAALSVPVGRQEGARREGARQPGIQQPGIQRPGGAAQFGPPATVSGRPGVPGASGPYAGDGGSAPAGPSSAMSSMGPSAMGPPGVAGAAGAAPPPLPPPVRPEAEPFRFRATVAQRGDTLLLCSPGLAEPLRAEPAFAQRLAQSWSERDEPPGLAAFLAEVQLRVRGYADDRTAVAVWEN